MEILDFDLKRESSFSSLRGSKEALLGVPGRSFYEVLRFLQKKFFFDVKIFFRLIEFSKNLKISDFRKIENFEFC